MSQDARTAPADERIARDLEAAKAAALLSEGQLRDWIDAALCRAAADPELSEREAEVLRPIALGDSNKEIAARLKLSIKTVETYKLRSAEKLGLRGRVALVRYAAACGWLGGAMVPPSGRARPPLALPLPARSNPSGRRACLVGASGCEVREGASPRHGTRLPPLARA
jgi:DNA-binding CsgD family transcriptional regulator